MGYKNQNKTVMVGLSGGVDSAVSASLLMDQYLVESVFMKNWSGDSYGLQADCPWEEDQKAAQEVAEFLKINFRSLNFEKEYRAKVIDYFFKELKAGRTPNPDVMCNKEIKFGLFLDRAMELGADFIATGHYARNLFNQENEEFELHKGNDSNKDQSYFLHRITQDQLTKTLFPIGEYTKPQIREIAQKLGLPNATRPDSQGICFVGEINIKKFIAANIKAKAGVIVDIDTNKAVGKHDGVWFYTIGQREGLGIGGSGEPYYVSGKDTITNTVYVAKGNENPKLFTKLVKFEDLHLINKVTDLALPITASVRYRHQPEAGKLNLDKMEFTFNNPQRGVSPGQSIVFYQGTKCLGGAIIQ